jgi:hypothetical protein
VVVLTARETASSGVLAVLANTPVAGGDVAAVLASFAEARRHWGVWAVNRSRRHPISMPWIHLNAVFQFPRWTCQYTQRVLAVTETRIQRMNGTLLTFVR